LRVVFKVFVIFMFEAILYVLQKSNVFQKI